MGVVTDVGVGLWERESGREKAEEMDWGELVGVGRLRWRKGGYRSREEDIYIKGAILIWL